MNRRFRLAALERLREARLEEATRALAATRRAVADTVTARDAVAAELAGTVPAPRTLPPTGPGPAPGPSVTPSAVTAAGSRRDLLRERLAAAEHAVAEAAQEARDALQGWQLARADLRVVQALHARHRAAVAVAQARLDQRVLDDLAAQVAVRRNWPEHGEGR